jgi:hypothetical protein
MNLIKGIARLSGRYHLWSILCCIAFAVPLFGYMINGSAMRYSGDDYCYANVLVKNGFWKAQWVSYTQVQPYNGNRYALTLFSGLSSLFGPFMSGALPTLMILVWLVAMVFALRMLVKLGSIPLSSVEILLVAEALAFFSLYTAPSLSQSLYWRSGMLPYLAPLVANTLLFGFIALYVLGQKPGGGLLIIISLLSILAGGFSEAATMLQLGYLTILLLGAFLPPLSKAEWKLRARTGVWIAWIFSMAAALLLAFSPSNSGYLAKSSRPRVLDLLTIAGKSALSFIKGSLLSQPIPIVILFLFSMSIGWLISSRHGSFRRFSFVVWVRVVIVVALISLVLIFACMLPSAYIQSAYPELRALITARYAMVLAIGVIGGMTGARFAGLIPSTPKNIQLSRVALVTFIAIASLYPIYGARNIYSEISKYQRWAFFWDQRDVMLRHAVQNDIRDVQVMKIDHIIPNVAELSENADFWYNVCAAGYYGVQSIRADLPGWDSP